MYDTIKFTLIALHFITQVFALDAIIICSSSLLKPQIQLFCINFGSTEIKFWGRSWAIDTYFLIKILQVNANICLDII